MEIREIEALSYDDAKEMAVETLKIKEHDCFLVDMEGRFGYSVLVFKNGRHIHYANDYQLHHSSKERAELRSLYVEEMNNKLFTDEELLEPVTSYDEYCRKSYFLRNYWKMRYDYLSTICIGEEERKEIEKAKKKYPYFNPICFCYVKDPYIVKQAAQFESHLEKALRELKNDDEAFRKMIRYELQNHEACITCDATDALSTLDLRVEDLSPSQAKIVKEELRKEIERYSYSE